MYNCNNGLPKSNHETLVPLMHFGNYVQFEHTQRNISLPKQCVNRKIPEHKITKWTNGIFEYLAIIKSEIMRLVTLWKCLKIGLPNQLNHFFRS